jgi:hypothetical protein
VPPSISQVTSYFRFLPKLERPSVGWSQSVPLPTWSYETPESVISTIKAYLAPLLLGKSIFDLETIHHSIKVAIASSFTTGAPIAKIGDLPPDLAHPQPIRGEGDAGHPHPARGQVREK